MRRILASDLLKIRKRMILFLAVLGPAGVIGLQAVNWGLRYDYLTKRYAGNLWGTLINDVRFLALPTLLLGLAILCSMIANIEHQSNAWKQTLALPVSRIGVYTSKFIVAAALLLGSSVLLGAGTVVLGLCLKFGTGIPFLYLLKMALYPYLASMPFIALQIWLSVIVKNQAVPLTIGILGMVVTSSVGSKVPEWVPWKWPSLMNRWDRPLYSALAGVAAGLLLYLIGSIDFHKRDVK